jgi:hypothetical protein
MSNLVVSNISDGTTSVGTGYVVNGAAKVYAKYNTITSTTLTNSLNVSSLTDHGSGDTSTVFISAMTNRDYIVVAGADDTSWGTVVSLDYVSGNTSSVSRNRTASNNSPANYDCEDNYITIHGDLA